MILLAEAIFDREDGDALFHGLLVEIQNLVAAHIEFALVAPETIHTDRVFLAGFFAV